MRPDIELCKDARRYGVQVGPRANSTDKKRMRPHTLGPQQVGGEGGRDPSWGGAYELDSFERAGFPVRDRYFRLLRYWGEGLVTQLGGGGGVLGGGGGVSPTVLPP